MITWKIQAFVLTIIMLWSAAASLAATVTVIQSGVNSYTVQGEGMDGVHGIELNINYDNSSLSNPSVSSGSLISGATFITNTNNPGSIRIGSISLNQFSGSGQIANIIFAVKKGSGGITSVFAKLIDSSGAPVTALSNISGNTGSTSPGLISTPGIPFSQTPASSTTPSAGVPAAATLTPIYPGSVSLPSEGQSPKETKTEVAQAAPIPPPAETPPASVPAAKSDDQAVPEKPSENSMVESRNSIYYSSVLERFRVYKGEKNPANLIKIFNEEVSPSIRQQSKVAISNGTDKVKIVAALSSPNGKSPNFALNGASLVSLKRDSESGDWIIEVLPHINVLKASLTIMDGNNEIEFPLTVAPPVNGLAVSTADFITFLKNTDLKVTDLNGDGTRDYKDEFIYTAHYLMLQNEEKRNKAARGKL
jgi:hypothetical protein